MPVPWIDSVVLCLMTRLTAEVIDHRHLRPTPPFWCLLMVLSIASVVNSTTTTYLSLYLTPHDLAILLP